MTDKTVHCVYFDSVFNYEINPEDENNYTTSEIYRYRNNFKINFLKKIKSGPNAFYYFIITDTQLKQFNEHLDKYKIKEFIIAQRSGVCNQNYRFKNHPRLNWFLFNFPKDFKVE